MLINLLAVALLTFILVYIAFVEAPLANGWKGLVREQEAESGRPGYGVSSYYFSPSCKTRKSAVYRGLWLVSKRPSQKLAPETKKMTEMRL